VTNYPDTVPVFMQAGMGCIGCAAAHFENIEQGAMAHGIDIDELITALNDVVPQQ
ncbi:MAG: DUF1858 domain-containing protein, partial [Selenomonadaceae bacterium]|nr:DUF1858 domain-containing protein [Selenomonadaceae bacterium]